MNFQRPKVFLALWGHALSALPKFVGFPFFIPKVEKPLAAAVPNLFLRGLEGHDFSTRRSRVPHFLGLFSR